MASLEVRTEAGFRRRDQRPLGGTGGGGWKVSLAAGLKEKIK